MWWKIGGVNTEVFMEEEKDFLKEQLAILNEIDECLIKQDANRALTKTHEAMEKIKVRMTPL